RSITVDYAHLSRSRRPDASSVHSGCAAASVPSRRGRSVVAELARALPLDLRNHFRLRAATGTQHLVHEARDLSFELREVRRLMGLDPDSPRASIELLELDLLCGGERLVRETLEGAAEGRAV